MKLVRLIHRDEITLGQINSLSQFGFTLVFTVGFIQVWIEQAAA